LSAFATFGRFVPLAWPLALEGELGSAWPRADVDETQTEPVVSRELRGVVGADLRVGCLDASRATARAADGVLTIRLPKAAP
jgi:HSP20 family molecular chaperone IbpA